MLVNVTMTEIAKNKTKSESQKLIKKNIKQNITDLLHFFLNNIFFFIIQMLKDSEITLSSLLALNVVPRTLIP